MPATESLTSFQMFIDGQGTDASRRDVFESDNRYTGKPSALIPRSTADDVDRAVRAAHRALRIGEWPTLIASKRRALLRRLGDLIQEYLRVKSVRISTATDVPNPFIQR